MFMRTIRPLSRATARPVVSVTVTGRRLIGSVSAIDSSIFRTLFGTEEIRKVCYYRSLALQLHPIISNLVNAKAT